MVDMNGLRMSLPAPCARMTAGVRPPRRNPAGSATTADTGPPPGSAIRRRRALGAIVFADAGALARLNAVVHPLIAAELGRRVGRTRAEGWAGPIVVEAAVLLEAGWQALVDRVWVVSASRENAIARVMAS